MKKIVDIIESNVDGLVKIKDLDENIVFNFYDELYEYKVDCYKFIKFVRLETERRNVRKTVNINYSYKESQFTSYISINDKLFYFKERVDKVTGEINTYIGRAYPCHFNIYETIESLDLKCLTDL